MIKSNMYDYILSPIVTEKSTNHSEQNKIVFKKGMLMVIQPNVVTPDSKYGLQVGNLVEVTEKGARSLQKFPMKFMKIR